MVEEKTGTDIIPKGLEQALPVPTEVLKEASKAAKALQEIVDQRKGGLVIQGKRYLQFEDWQTLGRFYGVTVGITWTQPLNPDLEHTEGYLAHAYAYHNGIVVSEADSQCDRSEDNWKEKPPFQLRSMAQTRACAKALRNVLAWVAVLAGYEPTPAEEMDSSGLNDEATWKPELATEPQRKAILTIAKSLGVAQEEAKRRVCEKFALKSFDDLTKQQAGLMIGQLKKAQGDKGKQQGQQADNSSEEF